MLATIGVQSDEVSNILDLAKDSRSSYVNPKYYKFVNIEIRLLPKIARRIDFDFQI